MQAVWYSEIKPFHLFYDKDKLFFEEPDRLYPTDQVSQAQFTLGTVQNAISIVLIASSKSTDVIPPQYQMVTLNSTYGDPQSTEHPSM